LDPAVSLQERSIYDGRHRLVFRCHLNQNFKVPEDLINLNRWENPVYAETINRRYEFPIAYRFLAERDSDQPVKALSFELYDRDVDPWEINNLWGNPEYKSTGVRLVRKLKAWAIETNDNYMDTKILEQALNDLENGTEMAEGGGSTCFIDTATHGSKETITDGKFSCSGH
jgi:hypothetical protein